MEATPSFIGDCVCECAGSGMLEASAGAKPGNAGGEYATSGISKLPDGKTNQHAKPDRD